MKEKVLQIKRGLDATRTTYTPRSGEFIYTTDKNQLYIGDGSTPGGIHLALNPPKFLEWNFISQTGITEYTREHNTPDFRDPNDGIYMVFYGASKLYKDDYSIRYMDSALVLTNAPEDSGVNITVCYMGM